MKLTLRRPLPLLLALLLPLTAGLSFATDYDAGDFSKFPQATSEVDSDKIRLGTKIDGDDSGGGLLGLLGDILGLIFTPDASAMSDDATGDADEDGVVVPQSIAQGGTVTIPVTILNKSGQNAYLNAWVDFDNNGTLTDVIYTTAGGEKVTNQIALASNNNPATQNITFTVPANASTGTGRGMRVRITSVSNPGPDGRDGKGEVEDYILNITTPGFVYGIGNNKVYEINVKTGVGSQISNMAFSGTGNAIAYHPGLGTDGALVYGTGETNDVRLAVWDRVTGANNIAGNLTSFGMGTNKTLRSAAYYAGFVWTVVDETDDLWKIALAGTPGNYTITSASKVSDLFGNNRGHIYGDFAIKPDGSVLAIALNVVTYAPEYFTANVSVGAPVATLRNSPPVSQNSVALGLDGNLYGGLGLFGNNEAWYTLDQTDGTILTTTTGSTLVDIADMTAAVAFSAPAVNPMQDYGDSSRFATSGSLRTNNLRLGGIVDGDAAVVTNLTATSDDITGADDEDGVSMPATMSRGEVVTLPITVYNNTGASAYLNAWMDFNNGGTINDVIYTTVGGERLMNQITIPTSTSPAVYNITFTVPLTASVGTGRTLRFRLNSIGGQGPTGVSGTGEVEDYAVTVDGMRLTVGLQVRPVGTSTWTSSSIAVEAGTAVEYGVTLSNAGDVTLRDPVVETLLPAPADTGVTNTNPRNSAYTLSLTGPATVSSGVTATYSTAQNPKRPEMLTPNPAGSVDPNWGAIPVNPANARAVKFDGTGLTLAPGVTLSITWIATLAWDATVSGTAYTSVGATATRVDLGTPVRPVESNKPGVQALTPTGLFYGDSVWNDANGNGIQDAAETGVNDVRVDLYRDNGDNVADPTVDTFVATTYTATISAKAGGYRFGKFVPGNYFAAISPPDSWSFATPDLGTNDAADSDAQTLIRNNRRVGVMPVTQISSGESDLTWDAGMNDRSGVPAVWAVVESSGGRRLLGGRFTKSHGVARNNIVRVTSNGSVDTTFDPGAGFNDSVRSIAIRSDGLIWVGGNFSSYNGNPSQGVALLSESGAWDNRAAQPNTSNVNWVGASGNMMYLAGNFTKVGPVTCGNIARLTDSGAVDTGWVGQGNGANGTVYGGAVQSDGSVIITGAFTSFHGSPRKGVAKLKNDGKLDTVFNPGTGAAGEVYSVKLIEDGRMVITGNFSSFSGVSCNGAVRLNANGSVDTTMNPSSLNVNTISTSN